MHGHKSLCSPHPQTVSNESSSTRTTHFYTILSSVLCPHLCAVLSHCPTISRVCTMHTGQVKADFFHIPKPLILGQKWLKLLLSTWTFLDEFGRPSTSVFHGGFYILVSVWMCGRKWKQMRCFHKRAVARPVLMKICFFTDYTQWKYGPICFSLLLSWIHIIRLEGH